MRMFAAFALWGLLLSVGQMPSHAFAIQSTDQTLVKNSSFQQWTNGVPDGWNVGIGAYRGSQTPASEVRQGAGPSLELHGDRTTKGWNYVMQEVTLQPGAYYQLRFTAKSTGIRLDENQFDNCYGGIFLKNGQDKNVSQVLSTVGWEDYLTESLVFAVPEGITRGQLFFFLSKTGTLNVKEVVLKKLDKTDSFEILAADMDRHYSHFELKQIDWKALCDRYRTRANAAKNAAEFVDVVSEMLAELKDGHVWIMHQGRRIQKFQVGFDANYDFSVVDRKLKIKKVIGDFALVGRTEDGFGYVRIVKLFGIDQERIDQLINEIEALFDAPGMIVDLRRNQGGAEPIAATIAGMFTNQEMVYATHKFRSGPSHDAYTVYPPRVLEPRKGKTYTHPIVCLTGPGAISSGEGFAMMMAALPHCTLMGQATRGSSGNPAPIKLPNGVDVYYSRWVSMLPDGTPIEDTGVPPDIEVEHVNGQDATFDAAVQRLKQWLPAE